jgi:hypothetical protein
LRPDRARDPDAPCAPQVQAPAAPVPALARRSPADVAAAAARILAADLGLRAGRRHEHEKLFRHVRLRKPVSHKDRRMPGAVPPSLPPGPMAPPASAAARARRAAELMS